MCGFSDVRQRLNSTYYCTKCYKDLGREFDKTIAAMCGKREREQLKRQCSAPQHSEPHT
jgi:hypothetical protein